MFANGTIIIYELPTFAPHGAAVGGVFQLISSLIGAHCRGGTDSLMTSVLGGWSKQPDTSHQEGSQIQDLQTP